jgi:transposase InsO family protein
LTEKDRKFTWNEECQLAFEQLKTRLTTAPILTFPDFSCPFILDTDASGVGIGAVLSQIQDGKERVIAYASRKLSKAERKYSVTKQELLAAVVFIKRFRHYLMGRRFKLRTDHASLKWLSNFKETHGQLARWFEVLGMFEFDIEHRAGIRHGNADALSRMPESPAKEVPQKILCCGVFEIPAWDKDHVRKQQMEDQCLNPIIQALEKGTKPLRKNVMRHDKVTKALWMQWDQLSLENGILYRRFLQPNSSPSIQLVVPASLREEVLLKAHDDRTAGHLGQYRTYKKVQKSYYWPGYRDHISLWVSTCHACQARKRPVGKRRRAKMRTAPVGNPLDRVAMDILGPLPLSDNGNRYVIVIMDYFTKWAEAVAIPDQTAITVARAFVTQFVCRLGVPYKVHTDQGPNFESELFREVCKLLGIEKTRTTPYRPQSDGLVERFNSTLEQMLAMYVTNDQTDWDEHLPFVMMAYRASIQETTNATPNSLMLGRDVNFPLTILAGPPPDVDANSPSSYATRLKQKLENAYEVVRVHSNKETKRQKRVYDTKAHGQPFKVGDKVWLYTYRRKKGLSPKLMSFWQGPCVIKDKYSAANYHLQLPNGHTSVTHFDRLKPYQSRSDEDNAEELNFPDTDNNLPDIPSSACPENVITATTTSDPVALATEHSERDRSDEDDAEERICPDTDNDVPDIPSSACPENVLTATTTSDPVATVTEHAERDRPQRKRTPPAWMKDYQTFDCSDDDM